MYPIIRLKVHPGGQDFGPKASGEAEAQAASVYRGAEGNGQDPGQILQNGHLQSGR